MKQIFDIERFNVVSDDENYYFFRSLEPGDVKDLENGIIKDGDAYIRLRTDRERWEEDKPDIPPQWNKDSQISLEEMYRHIKTNYSLQTNCISLSSNANVVRTYEEMFSAKYVMIRVPKKEMGQRVFHAGQYMLEEIEKIINEAISSKEIQEEILEDLERIDSAETEDEIKDIIRVRYTARDGIDVTKSGMRTGITYKAPHARVSSYQALDKEQSLEKNKIIAKLTVLETKGGMPALMKRSKNNVSLISTIGSAFASSEQIYYGDIAGENIQDISKEMLDIFGLLQQVEGQDKELVDELKREVIKFITDGKQIEHTDESEYKVKDDITIEEMYELTQGRVEYGDANSIVKNMFYVSKSQSNARRLVEVLNEITGNNPKYRDVLNYIRDNGFGVEPQITTRQSHKGIRISESVNLNLKPNEQPLAQAVKELTIEERREILENGGLSNVKSIMTDTFSKIESDEKISEAQYYAGAIIDAYNWGDIGIEEFSVEERNKLLQKLQENDCVEIYKKLKDAGISEKDIPVCVLNIASKDKLKEIITADNFEEFARENMQELTKNLSIEGIERFLGYYEVEGTEIILRDYQQNAVDKTDNIFEDKKFASVVLPTGAGKSFVAVTELLKHKDEPMLYLAPQEEILNQTKDLIIKYVHGRVGTVGKTKDEIIAEVFPNLKFETYSGLLAKRGKQVVKEQYGFIVFDELHRTGAPEWEDKIDKLLENQSEEIKVLGITATPTRDVDDRNMADEIALKLGYTEQEIKERKHIAMDMDLVDAIRLGLVVNPKVVSCEYNLKTDGSMENLLENINEITDENVRKEKLEKYEKLRRKIDKAEGIPEILQSNVKQGGKYIVFIPVTGQDEEELEDEDGNKIGKKTGKDKIKEYEKQIQEYLKGSNIMPQFYSMLGAYSDKENERQLKGFETGETEDTKFMIVMNKANEGLHIDGVSGIIWFRALDENSRILYLQQLGRAIYSEDPNNPTPDEDRPVIIDLANNTINVNIDKELKSYTRRDDLELLTIIVDWVNERDGLLPNIDSTNRKEARYAGTLYRIQNTYMQYINGVEQFTDLEEEQIEQIKAILSKGEEIELWDTILPPKTQEEVEKIVDVDEFSLNGVMKDFYEVENEIDELTSKNSVERFIEKLEKLQELGVDVSRIVKSDTIQTLAEKSGIKVEQIKEIGLNPSDKIGQSKGTISQVYRGKARGKKPTEEQVETLLKMGISLELQERDTIQEFIEKLERLQEIGVDVSKMVAKDTIQTLAKKSGIMKEQVKEIGLNPNDKIGSKKSSITQAYRGNGESKKPTEEQVETLLKMGISLEERNIIQEFIEKLAKLQEIGVDVSKMVAKDTIQTLAEKSGIKVEQLKEIGLNPDDKIAQSKEHIAQVYRRNARGVKPTEEQVEALLKMGISLELQERDTIQEFIEKLAKLQELEVDVSKISEEDTIQTLAKKSGIMKEQVKEIGLNPNDKIGSKKSSIVRVYRGNARGVKPTEEQVEALLKMGISLELQERDTIQEFIEKLAKLQELGVDVSKMQRKDTIQTLAEKSGIRKEQLKEKGLNPNDKIASRKDTIAQVYRGKARGKKPTEEQVEALLKMGISLELQERDTIQEFIEKLERLQEIGVDVSKMVAKDTIQTLAKKSGIMKEQVKEIGLNPNDKIASKKDTIAQAYRGNGESKKPTEEQVETLLKMGISLELQERDVTQEFIDKLEKLQTMGVDVSKIQDRDTIQTLAKKSGIKVEQIKEIGLNPSDKIGNSRSRISQAYRGKTKVKKPTAEQVETLLKMGINLEKKTRTGKEIVEATISSLKDIEMADEEDKALKELVEKTKKGGIKVYE